ncbi:serine hydrolase [Pollutibacter soli]|uniref:serine hydrolase domain-containing protein n=1 Tax=Pollutibacter soli TaxID=3034157 RepID=UPI00301391EA
MTRCLSILAFCLSGFVYTMVLAQNQYYPDSIWAKKNSSESGMNAALLDSVIQFAINNENKMETDLRIAISKAYTNEPDFRIAGPVRPRGKAAGLIIHKGYIVAEWGDPSRVDMTFSVTKSFLSTVAGLAVDNKLIRNIDDRVQPYVWDGSFDEKTNSLITWRHLLTQSSDWSGCQFGFCDWADRPPKEGTIEDWKNRKRNAPGTVFEYNDVRVNLLAYSLLQVWRKPLPIVLKEKFMDPIGASTTWRWYGYDNSFVTMDGLSVQSVSGGGHFGGGLFINCYDMGRFGLLFLRNGKWKDQQVISSQWVNEAHQPSAAEKGYGLLWWTNLTDELKGVSQKVYYSNGFGGNYIVIDNEHDLVIVTRWLDGSKLNGLIQRTVRAISSK